MKIGVCGGPARWQDIAEAGYDYAEAKLSDVVNYTKEQLAEYRRTLAECGIKAESLNGFFTGDVDLYGESDGFFTEYAKRAFENAVSLGGEVVVLGSGKARFIPENAPREDYVNRFCEITSLMGDIAREYNIRIVLEPLSKRETNFINYLSDGLEMCRKIDNPAVGTLIDFFHVYRNEDKLECIKEAAPYLWHTHIARMSDERVSPTVEDMPSVLPYAKLLKEVGYEGRISIEGKCSPDFVTAIHNAKPVMDLFK